MEDNSQDQNINVNPTDQPPGTGVNLSLSDIDVLRDRLEQQKANKLKAEQLVSTLSRIKAREKATRKSTKPGEKKIEDGVSTQPTKRSGTNSSNALKEKSNLLKKKLEEDRAKFESKKGQEDLGRVSQIVEHIRVQLEDQDKTIQQMHSNFAATARSPQPIEEVVPPEPDIPAEVKQRIADLEMKILDLQENLREKDSVISARTQAITLLSEDMARKGKNTLDTLEETRSQMKTMQSNFVALEGRMNEERIRLKEELEAKKHRLQQFEKNYRSAESARFDLSTRVAELQEKVVTLQTRNLALESEVIEFSGKTQELQEALDNSNKQIIKMKAQFKTKLKALEEERDMLRKEERTNEELNRLCERIADLEDEKEAGVILKERIAEMEAKLHRQEMDLDSHIKAMTLLEAEKLDLIEALSKKNDVLKEKDEMLEVLHKQISQINETKIIAEMKCMELEEKLDAFMKKDNDAAVWSSELENTKLKLAEYQELINELTMKLESKESVLSGVDNNQDGDGEGASLMKNLQDVSSSLEEWQNRCDLLEKQLSSTLSYCEELESRNKAMENDNERLLSECNDFNETVNKLNCIINTKSDSSNEEAVSLRQTLAQKEVEICNLNKHNKTLETEADNLRHALQSATAELHRLSQQVEDLSGAQLTIEELSATLDDKGKELEQTAEELEHRSRKLSEYKKFHKLKCEDVLKLSHELETVSTDSQQRITELESALGTAQQTEEDLRKEIKKLKENVNKEPEAVDTKLQEQTLKMKKLAANVKLKTKLVKDLESKVEELEKMLQQKESLISGLEIEKENLQKQSVEQCGNVYTSNFNESEEKCKILEVELNSMKEELKSKIEELECLKNASREKFETLVQIKELENQNKKLNDISETKSDQLKKMENELSDLSGLNKSLLTELEQMQETYKEDSIKNESVLDSFEHEMLGNKKDILELSNQLKDVTSKYEQTWAKLQEKEVYIEDLEQKLEKVKLRLLQIESTVEDRRRSLEEKAEQLGARLCLAEKNNEELEKHEGELEQKIAYMLNTEEILGNVLQKLQEENVEISKSLAESTEKNVLLTQELGSEREKVKHLTKEAHEMHSSLAGFEQMAEELKTTKKQLKGSQEARENQVKYLESRLAESEQCMDGEIRRLMDKVTVVEGERQEIVEKFNSLLIEKQMLEEEMASLHQTIADLTKEELEPLKINHQNLIDQMNKELEKRQFYINRIQELETQIKIPNMSSETHTVQNEDNIVELKKQLDKQLQENERLNYELLKEKAIKHIDDVVSKAEETYFTMTDNELESKVSALSLESVASTSNSGPIPILEQDKIDELENKVSILLSENSNLKSRVQELESLGHHKPENNSVVFTESDEWAAVNKDEDDGWGWGGKDAMLEHEYIQKQKNCSDLEAKVVELEKRICSFEQENKRLSEDLRAAQTKCSKLVKKVKEFKSKSDSLERSSRERSVGFDDLDLAMQEELRAQVEKLEKSLKESNANLNTLQQERENFLKRIDTLTSGNERLIEMKERQDIEVEMWQRRSNELQNKIQGLEWTIEELHAEQLESNDAEVNNALSGEEKQNFLQNAVEMEEKLNALAAENDYLQSLLGELKDNDRRTNPQLSKALGIIGDQQSKTQQKVGNKECLLLKQEIDRLNFVIQTLQENEQTESKNTNENAIEYSDRIQSLIRENEWISSSMETMQTKSEFCSRENVQSLIEKCSNMQSENELLKSKVAELNEKLSGLKDKFDDVQTERNNYNIIIEQLEIGNEKLTSEATKLSDDATHEFAPVSSTNSEESPPLFQGFTSSNNDLFEVSLDSVPTPVGRPIFHVDPSISASKSGKTDFFDTIKHGIESAPSKCEVGEIEQPLKIAHMSSENAELQENPKMHGYHMKIVDLKTLLDQKESELNLLRERLKRLEDENNGLKRQLDTNAVESNSYENTVLWGPFSGLSNDEFSTEKSSDRGRKLNYLTKQLEEKNYVIKELEEKLNTKSNIIGDERHHFVNVERVANDCSNDLFSQSENNPESQVEDFVEQITQLTKTMKDKEVEVSLLTDKKNKYKDMYFTLLKDYEGQSPAQSNSDKDQNIMLNQLLEDKETELEIMSQQIEQSKVAKDNLQDELSLKLGEMEAASSTFTIPELPKEILLPTSQPENIEEVRSLCAEVAELTKLLQEKEVEVEILKQQIDELHLEKENLQDEWKKEKEMLKEKCITEANKAEEVERELETFKDVILSDIEKQYKDELSFKEQQLMNAMNDLRNTHSFCQDIQTKLTDLQNSLENSNMQNSLLIKELNDVKDIQSSIEYLTQEIGFESKMNLAEKVQKLKDSLLEVEIKYEEAKSKVEEKDKIILGLKEKLKVFESSSSQERKVIVDQPSSSVQMKTFASEPFRISTEQSSSDDDSSSKHMENMEGQMKLMKEIQSLKQVLAMKDSEITRLSIALNGAQENLIREELRYINSEEESLRHRLDEALYTLHLRDVRCDELALELMQLLEERDSLQLRLSNAIRFNEELREKSSLLDETDVRMASEVDNSPTKDEEAGTDQLRQKLDQLHNVGYRRDPGLQQDQQRRHNEQMHLYTPHAAQEESQSSLGFFNWIFGTSPSDSQDV